MNREDYLKYYIQGSDHYLIPKDIFNELFNEMENWKKEAHQYKEVIDKAVEKIESWYFALDYAERNRLKIIIDILKEVI